MKSKTLEQIIYDSLEKSPVIYDSIEKLGLKNVKENLIDMLIKTRLSSVNLAISNRCHGNCIYCPKTRGKGKNINDMPLCVAKKIADEVASNKFREIHNVRKFEVGENGDALLNPDFLEIVRYLKKSNSDLSISLFTNFQYLTKDKSEIIVKEKLVDSIIVNIDGHDHDSYFRVKKIPYNVVEQNLIDFLEVRSENNSSINLTIHSMTFADYVKKVHKRFGKLPLAIKGSLNVDGLIDDIDLIRNIWKKKLNPKIDIFRRSQVFAWAERDTVESLNCDTQNLCPNLYRVIHECFIAPNGDWYACCLNDVQNIVFGNVTNKSINDIYISKIRSEFISLLKNGQYSKIGYPCTLVNACQRIR